MLTLSLTPQQAEALYDFLWTASIEPRALSSTRRRSVEADLAPLVQQLSENLALHAPVA
jgi:hypothetical protein